MNTGVIEQIILSIAGILIPVIFGIIGKFIVTHIKDKNLLLAITDFAKAGVVLAEKAGAVTYLTSSAKARYALTEVEKMLAAVGITSADESIIKAEIEKAYAEMKTDIESAYTAAAQPKLADSVALDANGDVIAKGTTSK